MTHHLKINNLVKRYNDGTITAVENFNIDIEDGELLVFVGPSGCGKSTTLRCVAGLEDVTSGQIILDGNDITDSSPQNRDIAMVFQNYALYPHMSARDNISFGLRMTTDLPKREIRDQVANIAQMLDIEDILDKRPPDLSGGQQQRVALGRAVIRDPEVFLMDEPLSNLDAKLRTKMRTEILELQQDLGVTTIYVTHDQTEAMTMGDRIAVLNDGELQQVGTPIECYRKPTNKFVASFIGSPSMNFISVEYDHKSMCLSGQNFNYEISERIADQLANSQENLTLGVRPEALIEVEKEKDADLTCEIDVVEPRGDVTYLSTSYGDQTIRATIPRDHSTIKKKRYTEGQPIRFSIPQSAIHLFDANLGKRVIYDPPSDKKQHQNIQMSNTGAAKANSRSDG